MMRENHKFCYHCKTEKSGLIPLVRSEIIHPVWICIDCRTEHYPWLKPGATIPQKKWVDNDMKPKGLEPTEYGEGKKLKRNGMRKCQYNADGHVFDLTPPKFVGSYGHRMKALSVKQVYEEQARTANQKGFMKGNVFVFWKCRHCGKEKYEILSVEKTLELIKDL